MDNNQPLKGLWQLMQELEQKQQPPPEPFTIKKLIAYLQVLFEQRAKQPRRRWEMPADDYAYLSDEAFRAFATSDRYKFVGGREGCERMMKRCKALGIT